MQPYLHPNKKEIFQSKIVYKTLNPVFDQLFEFHNLQLDDDIHRQSLVFWIYDDDKLFKNKGIVLPLRDADVYGVHVVYKMRVDERVEKFKSVRNILMPVVTQLVCK